MWDTPISSLDRAVWWIEYVIRNKGNPYLRSPTADLPWVQLLMLDVIGFFLGCLLVILTLTYYVIKRILRLCKRKPNKSKLKKK